MTKKEQIIEQLKQQVAKNIVEGLYNTNADAQKQKINVGTDGKLNVSAPVDVQDIQSHPDLLKKIQDNPELMAQIKKNPQLAMQLIANNGTSGMTAVNPPSATPSFTNTNESVTINTKFEGILKEWREHNGQQFTTLYNDTLTFDEIQVFANSINNIYRNAAQRWLQDLQHKKYAQNIVFILKQRGFLPETSTDEAIQSFQDLLESQASQKLKALVYNNCFVVMFGFYVETAERKHFIQSETWYTVDGHLRAINLNQFDNKRERTLTYKKAIGKVL